MYLAVTCSMWFLPEEYLCRFSGRFLPDTSYSALLGSTVDTCYCQFTVLLYSDPAFDSRPALLFVFAAKSAALVSTTALVCLAGFYWRRRTSRYVSFCFRCAFSWQWHVQGWYACDNAPRAVFTSLVGRPMMLGIMAGMNQKDSCPRPFVQTAENCGVSAVAVHRWSLTSCSCCGG